MLYKAAAPLKRRLTTSGEAMEFQTAGMTIDSKCFGVADGNGDAFLVRGCVVITSLCF